MSGIQIKDLSFAYEAGGKLILKDINTEIGEGEFVCILGQSGAHDGVVKHHAAEQLGNIRCAHEWFAPYIC